MQSKQIFKKILVPVDGSHPSFIAQELTAFLAKKFNSKATVIHVVSHELMRPRFRKTFIEVYDRASLATSFPQELVPVSRTMQAFVKDVTDWYHQEGKQSISEAVSLFKQKGIAVNQKLVEHTDPAETILEEAEKGNYDLIIMGHSGEEEKEPHLGSIVEKVSQHAKTPILIARDKKLVSKMLVPIDGSENAESAFQYATTIAKKTNAKMTLLYVQEPGLFKLKPEETEKIGALILSKAADKVKGIELDQKLESGDPAKIITQTANKGDFDLIVMGSRGHGGIMRFLLGSVSAHVIHYANRSTLIVK
jgi:nucleotide-binding universal stress UspA family protein